MSTNVHLIINTCLQQKCYSHLFLEYVDIETCKHSEGLNFYFEIAVNS